MLKILSALVLVWLCSLTVAAQLESVFIAPQVTDSQINQNLQNHYVAINRGAPAKNQLFVFFPGTGGVAFNYQEIVNTAANEGFHAVGLTYPNAEAVNELCGGGAGNTDLDCYARMRLEVKDGVDRTNLVNVNRPNSIENRLVKLLIYLRAQRPNENWGQFLLDDATINWAKIVVSGHSQGGGHAGIIARFHPVLRAVMFAAMDFNGAANAPANWIAQPNTTPNASTPDKFWGFSHRRDEFVNFTILTNRIYPAYGMPQFGAVVNVDAASPPYNNTHSLTSNIECENFHGCVAADARLVRDSNNVPVYKPVWQHLLANTPAPYGLVALKFLRHGQIVNRPPTGRTVKNYKLVLQGGNFDQNTKILINETEVNTEFVSVNEIRANFPAGKFGSIGSAKVQAVMPNGQKTNSLTY
ncbi:MAG: hypothetical protein M3384_10100 [Acidobacteriota bacterium]|nr:hypothetical protein [Acidobacteriota bacterium]